jgi:branched-chain amino acid transport system ATP-binding protein
MSNLSKWIARSFQRVNVYLRFNVSENVRVAVLSQRKKCLNLFSPAKKMFGDEVLDILDSVGLSGQAAMPAASLAHGDQKRLEVAIALANEPELLLLDEPTAGMSPKETMDTVELIKVLAEQRGLTVLFTEHDMDVVFSISKRITVMHQGAVIADGEPEVVRRDKAVQNIYLGEPEDA